MSDRQDIMGCYFRSWRDIATGDPDNKVSMRDLPAEVDIAFVFPDGNEPPRYWEALHSQIIPALHARKTKIVRTIAIDELIKPGASANDIFTRFFTSTPGLDGLDIDIEHTLNEAQRKQAEAVSRELRTLLGQERLFVFDTTENGDVALIRALAPPAELHPVPGIRPDSCPGARALRSYVQGLLAALPVYGWIFLL